MGCVGEYCRIRSHRTWELRSESLLNATRGVAQYTTAIERHSAWTHHHCSLADCTITHQYYKDCEWKYTFWNCSEITLARDISYRHLLCFPPTSVQIAAAPNSKLSPSKSACALIYEWWRSPPENYSYFGIAALVVRCLRGTRLRRQRALTIRERSGNSSNSGRRRKACWLPHHRPVFILQCRLRPPQHPSGIPAMAHLHHDLRQIQIPKDHQDAH